MLTKQTAEDLRHQKDVSVGTPTADPRRYKELRDVDYFVIPVMRKTIWRCQYGMELVSNVYIELYVL